MKLAFQGQLINHLERYMDHLMDHLSQYTSHIDTGDIGVHQRKEHGAVFSIQEEQCTPVSMGQDSKCVSEWAASWSVSTSMLVSGLFFLC